MITTRAELLGLLRTPAVVRAWAGGGTVEELAEAILAARDGQGEPPVGERWDAVESGLIWLGFRPIGHVGRCPVLELTSWENMLMRLNALPPPEPPG